MDRRHYQNNMGNIEQLVDPEGRIINPSLSPVTLNDLNSVFSPVAYFTYD